MSNARRRRALERDRPRDTRELFTMPSGELVPCEAIGAAAALRMQVFDALPPEYRAVCNEFKLNAADVGLLGQRGVSPDDVRARARRAGCPAPI